jgi:hypothetical protein
VSARGLTPLGAGLYNCVAVVSISQQRRYGCLVRKQDLPLFGCDLCHVTAYVSKFHGLTLQGQFKYVDGVGVYMVRNLCATFKHLCNFLGLKVNHTTFAWRDFALTVCTS